MRLSYSAMMIKAINTLVTNSTVLAVLEDLQQQYSSMVQFFSLLLKSKLTECETFKHSCNANIKAFQDEYKLVTELIL